MSLSTMVLRYAGAGQFPVDIKLYGRIAFRHIFTQANPSIDVTDQLSFSDLQKDQEFMALVDSGLFEIDYTAGSSDPYVLGNVIEEQEIEDGAITEDKLDDGAVTTDKIEDGAVTAAKLEEAYVVLVDSVTDNSVVRFNGTDGEIHDSPVVISDDGEIEVDVGVEAGVTGVTHLVTGFLSESHTLDAAATSDTVIEIPANSIVKFVSVAVTTAITGATSFDVGVAGATDRYGDDLAITDGTTNVAADPRAYAVATPIRFTANGSDFTGGVVLVCIHYETVTAPTN